MKTTKYFDYRRNKSDRIGIPDAWIEHVIAHAEKTEIQSDGRIKKWARIEAAEGRYLRVILLEDGVTVHNAFFDRGFEG